MAVTNSVPTMKGGPTVTVEFGALGTTPGQYWHPRCRKR